MEEVNRNQFSVTPEEFMDNFTQLLNTLRSYQELINKVDTENLDPKKIKSLVMDSVNNLRFGGVNIRSMELIGTYLRFSLEKFKGDKMQFMIPEEPDDGFFTVNRGYEELSVKIEEVEKEMQEIEEKIYFLTRMLPPQNIDKIRLVLKTIASLFKSVVRKDLMDIENHINHLHHLTANKDSFYLINEIGHMVRGIHDSLRDFSEHVPADTLDPGIVDDMPDAIDKLNLVIQRMEKSANSTLDDIEELLEQNSTEQENNIHMTENCREIIEVLEKTHGGSEGSAESKEALERLKTQVLGELTRQSEVLKENEQAYFRVIGNQSFQDITGQTLKKIISFIEQLELNLLNILQKYSAKFGEKKVDSTVEQTDGEKPSPLIGKVTDSGLVLEGPQDNKPKSAEGEPKKQADIDNILAQFGF